MSRIIIVPFASYFTAKSATSACFTLAARKLARECARNFYVSPDSNCRPETDDPLSLSLSLSLRRDAFEHRGRNALAKCERERERDAKSASRIAREGRNESRESAGLLFPLPLVIVVDAGSRVFFSRRAGSNYFSGPRSHGRLVPPPPASRLLLSYVAPSWRILSARSRGERKCKGEPGEQKPPLRRGRSVVPRVIRTGEKKLAKLNVRPCLGSSKGSKGATTSPSTPSSSRPFFLRVHFGFGLFAINYPGRRSARKIRISGNDDANEAQESRTSIRNRSAKSSPSGYIALE